MNLARRAVRNFPRHPLASIQETKHLRRAWLRAVTQLGDRWILARSINSGVNQ